MRGQFKIQREQQLSRTEELERVRSKAGMEGEQGAKLVKQAEDAIKENDRILLRIEALSQEYEVSQEKLLRQMGNSIERLRGNLDLLDKETPDLTKGKEADLRAGLEARWKQIESQI